MMNTASLKGFVKSHFLMMSCGAFVAVASWWMAILSPILGVMVAIFGGMIIQAMFRAIPAKGIDY